MIGNSFRSIKLPAVLIVALALCGCSRGDSQRVGNGPVDEPNPSEPILKESLEKPAFELEISAVGDDPAVVEVTVTAADAATWSNIDTNDTARLQSGLVFYRSDEAGDTSGGSKPPQPILGRYEVEGDRLRFRPAFSLVPGEFYAAKFEPAKLLGQADGDAMMVADYQVPKLSAERPEVTAIYPSGNIVPANHLKFYVQFSEPMQRDGIFEYFRLIDLATDKPVPRPFRHVELWSQDFKQLTLWFHPGRQKQGVNLNVEIGPILQPDGEYRLEIDGEWKSERGVALGETFVKTLRAAPADHTQPKPASWILSSPPPGTRNTLTCDFHEPLDWALLHSEIVVETVTGQPVGGRIELGYGELSWAFQPVQPWEPGKYRLTVGPLLEDLAGNSVGRPFEVDLDKQPAKTAVSAKPVSVEFQVFDSTE